MFKVTPRTFKKPVALEGLGTPTKKSDNAIPTMPKGN